MQLKSILFSGTLKINFPDFRQVQYGAAFTPEQRGMIKNGKWNVICRPDIDIKGVNLGDRITFSKEDIVFRLFHRMKNAHWDNKRQKLIPGPKSIDDFVRDTMAIYEGVWWD